jgi:hypothetical protein
LQQLTAVPRRLHRFDPALDLTMPYKTPLSEPIAVLGASCRFAGDVTTPSRLWQLLSNPVDLTREVPAERFNIKVSKSYRWYHRLFLLTDSGVLPS